MNFLLVILSNIFFIGKKKSPASEFLLELSDFQYHLWVAHSCLRAAYTGIYASPPSSDGPHSVICACRVKLLSLDLELTLQCCYRTLIDPVMNMKD
jgi:hypothetical protein